MPIDLSIVGRKLDSMNYEYSEKDVMLYALGVGCGPEDLEFVYEQNLKVLPTFAAIPATSGLFALGIAMGTAMQVNPMMILHGEQRIDLLGPIPTAGRITTTPTIRAVYDKGSGALVVTETEGVDAKGKLLFKTVFGVFVRGEGGFGGERGPSGPKNVPPERKPDRREEMKTLPQQALLYRLSGDMNPLHADPSFAKIGGFDRPTLHGLCTFGHVGRAVLRNFCGGDPGRLRSFEVRFSGVVFPGETVVTEMWEEKDGRVVVQARTKERGDVVISNAAATVA